MRAACINQYTNKSCICLAGMATMVISVITM